MLDNRYMLNNLLSVRAGVPEPRGAAARCTRQLGRSRRGQDRHGHQGFQRCLKHSCACCDWTERCAADQTVLTNTRLQFKLTHMPKMGCTWSWGGNLKLERGWGPLDQACKSDAFPTSRTSEFAGRYHTDSTSVMTPNPRSRVVSHYRSGP